jgi:hypothetical protein
MNLTEQEKYTLIGSASGFILSRIFGAGLFGSLVLVGVGGYAGYNSDKIKSFVASKSKKDLSYLAGGEKASEEDAKKMIEFFNKSLNYSEIQQQRFVDEYTKSISKKENDYLVTILDKEQSTFTYGEKKLYSKLIDILKGIIIQKD